MATKNLAALLSQDISQIEPPKAIEAGSYYGLLSFIGVGEWRFPNEDGTKDKTRKFKIMPVGVVDPESTQDLEALTSETFYKDWRLTEKSLYGFGQWLKSFGASGSIDEACAQIQSVPCLFELGVRQGKDKNADRVFNDVGVVAPRND